MRTDVAGSSRNQHVSAVRLHNWLHRFWPFYFVIVPITKGIPDQEMLEQQARALFMGAGRKLLVSVAQRLLRKVWIGTSSTLIGEMRAAREANQAIWTDVVA